MVSLIVGTCDGSTDGAIEGDSEVLTLIVGWTDEVGIDVGTTIILIMVGASDAMLDGDKLGTSVIAST